MIAGAHFEVDIVDAPQGTAALPSVQARVLLLVEILTVGLPFCVFKAAGGVTLLGLQRLEGLAWLLIILGALDALLNGVNAITVGALGRRRLPVCVLQAVTHAVRRTSKSANVGTALDVMLSFVLVAVMIGAGALGRLTSAWLSAWNLAVVLNVLGAGALRLAEAVLPRR